MFGRGKGIPHCVACNGGGLIQNDLIILERERERERERGNRLQHKSKSGLISFVQNHKQLKIQKNMHFLLLESQKSPIVKQDKNRNIDVISYIKCIKKTLWTARESLCYLSEFSKGKKKEKI